MHKYITNTKLYNFFLKKEKTNCTKIVNNYSNIYKNIQNTATLQYFSKKMYTFFYTKLFKHIQNKTEIQTSTTLFFKIVHNSTQLHKHIQISDTTYYTTFFTRKCTQLYKTIQQSRKLYNTTYITLQHFTQLYTTLHNYTKYTLLLQQIQN
jgi:hypothetical protein